MNLILGVFATALILGVLSTGTRPEHGRRSGRGKTAVGVIEARATEKEAARAAA